MTEETKEVKQRAFYFVTTSIPNDEHDELADACVFVELETEDGKGQGLSESGACWEENPNAHSEGMYRLGPFAKYGDVREVVREETQEESDARYDAWWEKAKDSDEHKKQREDYYAKWIVDQYGTEMQAWLVSDLLKETRRAVFGEASPGFALPDEVTRKRFSGQVIPLAAAQGLVHPVTGEPLLYTLAKPSNVFDGSAVYLTEEMVSVQGYWFPETEEWKLYALPVPKDWTPTIPAPTGDATADDDAVEA